MTDNKSSVPRMDVPAVREAFIDLRVAQLRLLAAETAVEFLCEQCERSLSVMLKRAGSDGHKPKD